MKSRVGPLVVLLKLCSLTSVAVSEEITLEKVLRSVQRSHPVLEATRQEAPAARAELLASQGAFDVLWRVDGFDRPAGYYDYTRSSTSIEQPTTAWGTRLFASYAVTDGKLPMYEGKQETTDGGELRAGFEVPLLRDGPIDRRRASITRAEIGKDLADTNIQQRAIELRRAATNAYYEWTAAGLRRGIYQGLLEFATGRTAQLEQRMQAGDIPEFDLLDNRRSELQRRAQVVAAERSLRQAAFELSLHYRDEEGRPLLPKDSDLPRALPRPSSEGSTNLSETIAEALKRRPELQRVDAQRKQNEVEVSLQENQLRPKFDLQVATSKDLGNGKKEKRDAEFEVGIKLELPLQTRVAEGKRASALAKISELNLLETFAKDRIATDVKDAIVAIERSRERVKLATAEAEAARKLEQGERKRFVMGDSNLIFVNLREQTAAEAAIREVDALLDFQKALAAYQAALAEPIPASE